MSYVKPSVLVYQDLENAGGVANSTPDLEACVFGPAYNILTYVPGSIPSQVKTAALSAVTTTGSITANSDALTVDNGTGIGVGDQLQVAGAAVGGGTLQGSVLSVAGNVFKLDTTAGVTVKNVQVTKVGKLTNPLVAAPLSLPGQLPGQVVDPASISPWLNAAKVQTLASGVEGLIGTNTLNIAAAGTSGAITTGSASLTVVSPSGITIGDSVIVAGAGATGDLTATVIGKSGSTLTLSKSAETTVTTASVTKVTPVNVNPLTNSLRAESGDEVRVAYTSVSGDSKVFSSSVKSVVTNSVSEVATIELVDMLPSDFAAKTTGSITTGTTTLTVASASGIVQGSRLIVTGAGVNRSDLVTSVASITGTSATLSVSASTTVTASDVSVYGTASLSVIKTFNNQLLPITKPISGGSNYDTSAAGTDGIVTVNVGPELSHGLVVSSDVYFSYRALRTDLSNQLLTFENPRDLVGQLRTVSDENPLALGVQLALANTTGRIRGVATAGTDLLAYQQALEVVEGVRMYSLVPLTQESSILSLFKSHVVQMSTPENAAWRVTVINNEIPTDKAIGQFTKNFVNKDSSNAVTVVAGKYVLTSPSSTFISDGASPGDLIHITAASATGIVGVAKIMEVVSNQQLVLAITSAATGVKFYITRKLTKSQSAGAVAGFARSLNSNRAWLLQPDLVGVSVNGVTKYLPGYFLCAAHAGMVAGFPVQQGFTNIGVAGIVDLKHSNFYFGKDDLNTMAEAGVCLYVQETPDGIPYCRHALTTDVTVLEYREQLKVKNWDFLSYFYYDKLKGFIGTWNITKDTVNIIRQTINASSELLKGKKLPKIGAPLLSAVIRKLEQNKNNKDNLDVEVKVEVVSPLNYMNLHLVI